MLGDAPSVDKGVGKELGGGIPEVDKEDSVWIPAETIGESPSPARVLPLASVGGGAESFAVVMVVVVVVVGMGAPTVVLIVEVGVGEREWVVWPGSGTRTVIWLRDSAQCGLLTSNIFVTVAHRLRELVDVR